MTKFLDKVTVTGADDTIDPGSVIRISLAYPFAEFGLLMHASDKGSSRFPSRKWIVALLAQSTGVPLQLSAHLCGEPVKTFLQSGVLPSLVSDKLFKRVQINTHAIPHYINYPAVLCCLHENADKEFIFQYDGVNNDFVEDLHSHNKDSGFGPANASALFDLSHGAGELPKSWPAKISGIRCGYAGGLSPENVRHQIQLIEPNVANSNSTWIDAETHLRNPKGGFFDMERVIDFLKNSEDFVLPA